jgi:hypothetical protein
MSTKRGRKKAAAKPAAPVVQDEEPEFTAADLQATTKHAVPPSPIVTLAKQAITPVVAAAKRAASTIAAALPAIAEASAVDAAGLDFDQQQHPDSPRSPTGQKNPFSEPPSGLHDDLSLQDDDAATGSDQQQHGMHSSISRERDDLDDELEPQQDQQQQTKAAAAGLLGVQLKQQALLRLRSVGGWFAVQRSSGLLPVLALSMLLLAGLGGAVFLQGSALKAQQGTIAQQQQQVAAQQTALAALQVQLQQAQQQLQALPDMQQLQDAASSCKVGLGDLGSSQDSLQETLDALATLAGQLEANISSLSQASALGQKAWQLLEAATAANAAGDGNAAAAAAAVVAAPALLQQTQQQQALAQQLQDSMAVLDTLLTTIQQEVKQQLTAALPPVDLALADCGARIVFHTPLNSTAMATSASAADAAHTAGIASPASGPMHWLQQQVARRLLPGSAVAAKQPQGPLLSAAQINSIILRPQSAFPASTAGAVLAGNRAVQSQSSIPCLPLLLAPGNASAAAAVLEIALPQLATIQSVTFHHTSSALEHFGGSHVAATPGVVRIALANSSSCATGICSAVGNAALVTNTTTSAAGAADEAAAAADGAVAEDVPQLQPAAMLAAGVVGVQQEVQFDVKSFASGRAVVKIHAAAAAGIEPAAAAANGASGVVADRLIVHVSSRVSGGEGLCMQRISVQGVPLDPAAFC